MSLNILGLIGVFLVLLLALLLGIFFLRFKKKKTTLQSKQKSPSIDLESLVKKIASKLSSTQELQDNLDSILEYYGDIKDFTSYEKILLSISLHPNTNKNIILRFDKELSRRNPKYKKRISDTITDALNLR